MGKEKTHARRSPPRQGQKRVGAAAAAGSGARKKEGNKKKALRKAKRCLSRKSPPRKVRVPPPSSHPPGVRSVGVIIGVVDVASDVTTQFDFSAPDCYKAHSVQHCMAYAPFCKCPPEGRKLRMFSDVAAALLLRKQRPDLFVDIIYPRDVTPERLQKNTINFIAGYDILCAHLDSKSGDTAMIPSAEQAQIFMDAVRAKSSKVCPSPALQKFGADKRMYYQQAMDVGVPIAPTAFVGRGAERTSANTVAIARSRGWDSTGFVVKPSFGSWNMGVDFFFLKSTAKGSALEKRVLEQLDEHLEVPQVSGSPHLVIQKYIKDFDRFPEVRTFWGPDRKFMYAVANWNAGKWTVTTQRATIPDRYLEPAKEIGQLAIDRMLPPKQLWCTRIDVACESVGTGKLRFFMNEFDPTGSNNWHSARYPKSVPLMAKLFADAVDKA